MKSRRIAILGSATIAMVALASPMAQANIANRNSHTDQKIPGSTTVATTQAKWAPLMAAQQKLLAVSSPIQQYERLNPTSGFAGVRIDPYHNSVDLYWHGNTPKQINNVVGSATSGGITVRLHDAAHSLNQLLQAQKLLINSFASQHTQFAEVGPDVDGSGLDLTLPASVKNANTSEQISEVAGVPVIVNQGTLPQLKDRYEDTAPYWGGDYMQAGPNTGPSCTTGFAVVNSTGEESMLTASHCSPNGTGTWYTGGGSGQTTIGSDDGWDGYNDAMIIGTSSGGSIWGGAYLDNPSGQTALAVNGAGDPTVGELDCTSGSFSGENCGVQVVKVNQSITACESKTNCTTYNQLAQGEQQNHQDASGNGDSGGPVFTVINGDANARGTVTAGDDANTSTTCTGVPAGNGRTCDWRMWFPDIVDELGDFGVSIVSNG